jgi:glycosyltransferase involved in cell wall biosynthesis
MADPLVSVVLAVYGNVGELPITLRSIAQQTCSDYEIVLVDDGNAPEEKVRIAQMAAEFPRVRLLHNEKNLGLAPSLALGIDAARGRYISRIDNGDVMIPATRLNDQVSILEETPELAVVSGGIEVADFINHDRYQSPRRRLEHTAIVCQPPYKTWLEHVTVMFRKEVYHRCGGYNIKSRVGQDTELWPRMLQHGNAVIMPDIWAVAGMRPASISVAGNNRQIQSKIAMLRQRKQWWLIPIEWVKLFIPVRFRVMMRYRKNFDYLGKMAANCGTSLENYVRCYHDTPRN